MLNPEVAKNISQKFVNPETLDKIASKAYAAHCVILRRAGIMHLRAWESVGPVVQDAWHTAAATMAEEVLDMFMAIMDEVEQAKDG